jgi:hypothetical protein
VRQDDEQPRERPADHRRRTRRAERHTTSQLIHVLEGDDLDAVVPVRSVHDVGHKTSRPVPGAKPGRRDGFKVWKTSFWKRRKAQRHERALAERRLAEG